MVVDDTGGKGSGREAISSGYKRVGGPLEADRSDWHPRGNGGGGDLASLSSATLCGGLGKSTKPQDGVGKRDDTAWRARVVGGDAVAATDIREDVRRYATTPSVSVHKLRRCEARPCACCLRGRRRAIHGRISYATCCQHHFGGGGGPYWNVLLPLRREMCHEGGYFRARNRTSCVGKPRSIHDDRVL